MSLNSTPSSERIHIGIFGKRNAGKSSVINALTGQDLAIVSDIKGTTTDPVLKAMELLPLGPVVMIDTPGLDDEGELGTLRVQKAYQILNKTDIAVLVVDGTVGMTEADHAILKRIKEKSCLLSSYSTRQILPFPTGTRTLHRLDLRRTIILCG
ncbi:tRNA modification GTPase MnmE [[Clostridium] hylemonae DSM 15053]|nr:GTPase [[Clostridium] hylemonae]QEK18873.1 tRNA modification GTPase MnmE [[Clostridium] hylemonae DSM 15053]